MDENTRAIVASNLTIAVYSGQKVESAAAVMLTYREIFARLENDDGDDSGFSGAMPQSGAAR